MKPIALGLAAAIAISSIAPVATGTANAAPLSTSALSLQEAVPNDVIDVRRYYRGYGWGGGAAVAGLALGFSWALRSPHAITVMGPITVTGRITTLAAIIRTAITPIGPTDIATVITGRTDTTGDGLPLTPLSRTDRLDRPRLCP